MMAAFVTMVTETDGKPANEYEHVEGSKPMYRKKFRGAMRLFDPISEDAKAPCCVTCGKCFCVCCVCLEVGEKNQKSTSAAVKKQ